MSHSPEHFAEHKEPTSECTQPVEPKGVVVGGIFMSIEDANDQRRRARNRRIVQRQREHLMSNVRWSVLQGKTEAQATAEIEEYCATLLKNLNRGK